ncbi:uncharacterized protein LOC114288925 [Camellia sinensis]|uniref:uncharacterized protein LOC114288925 n=1 Tax=Camellia sinensis TaxID=4442 RepID=UPI0010360A91|nr:uncharacterized protein LOC114288925 [Camellia sinensis]
METMKMLKQSLQAELFRETKLIIWDEVPMQHRHCVEAVDRTLRDIRDSEKPFGGITVVLGGDFRQILLVIPKGFREQIVNASLRHFVLWKHIHILTLDLNMRLNHEDHENAIFAKFLMKIGTNPQEIINLPSTIHKCQDLSELLSTVYPQLNMIETPTPTFLTERTILSARNDDVSDINTTALNIFPGRLYTYFAADKMIGSKNLWSLKGEIQLACFDGDAIRHGHTLEYGLHANYAFRILLIAKRAYWEVEENMDYMLTIRY